MITRRVLLAATLSALWAGGAAAAPFPERPITLIVPFAPGGGTDLSARMIVPYIEKYLGGKVVVLNRPGAGGEIGATEIAVAKPDGYTIGFMNVPNTMMKPHERATKFNVDSFDAIANMVFDPAVMAVLPSSKFKTLADLVEEAKKRPGKVTVGSAGVGSNTHLDLIALEHAAGVQFAHVPFDGGAAPRNALLGGHVDAIASALGDIHRFSEDKKIHAVGILTKQRFPMAPNIPTYAEQGYAVEGGAGRGLVGPKGMPKEAIDAIAAAVDKALKDPELIKKTTDIALPLVYMGPEEYGRYLKTSDAELAAIWKRSPWVKK